MSELGQMKDFSCYMEKKWTNQRIKNYYFVPKKILFSAALTEIKFMWFSLWSYLIWGWTTFYNQIVGILRVASQSFWQHKCAFFSKNKN